MYRSNAALPGVCVIDVDTHLTEPHDLWTSRAPKKYVDRVPRVEVADDIPMWVVDDDAKLGRAVASSVIRLDRPKLQGAGEFFGKEIQEGHAQATTVGP